MRLILYSKPIEPDYVNLALDAVSISLKDFSWSFEASGHFQVIFDIVNSPRYMLLRFYTDPINTQACLKPWKLGLYYGYQF